MPQARRAVASRPRPLEAFLPGPHPYHEHRKPRPAIPTSAPGAPDGATWLVAPGQRGNPSTRLEQRRGGHPWTVGNAVTALVDGDHYFSRLRAELELLDKGDQLLLADWRGDADRRLDGPGSELGDLLGRLARRGVAVQGLVWRSHSAALRFNEQANRKLSKAVNRHGGEFLLDERVRGVGSHHQKLIVLRHPTQPERDVAFAGGIDLCFGRGDTSRHFGDAQAVHIDPRYGPNPAWHDVQLELRGPVVADLHATLRERWDDPTPLDHRNPWRALLRVSSHEPRHLGPLPPPLPEPPPLGTQVVQVLRTYPRRRLPAPFAPHGERSIARGLLGALGRARSLIYIEDQYLWSAAAARVMAGALRAHAQLHVIIVVPRWPDRDGAVSGGAARLRQQAAISILMEAGGARVQVCDLENACGLPIYVHAKVVIVDDIWASVGSANMNDRSWTYDSELLCAVIDTRRDPRTPLDPSGRGDGARVFARELRLRLWREHLGEVTDENQLLDPLAGAALWRERSQALDAWWTEGRRGQRPLGSARPHHVEPVPSTAAWIARPLGPIVLDPDGRPHWLRGSDRF